LQPAKASNELAKQQITTVETRSKKLFFLIIDFKDNKFMMVKDMMTKRK
jgi:hypothetical protein